MEDYIFEERKKAFKIPDIQPVSRKREEYALKLRKQKGEEKLREKRAKLMQPETSAPKNRQMLEDRLKKFDPDLVSSSVPLESKLKKVAKALRSPIAEIELLHALIFLVRRALSRDEDKPLSLAIELGFSAHFIAVLDIDSDELRNEAVWGLINITSGSSEVVRTIISLGAHRKVMHMLYKAPIELFDNCLWLLANLSGDSVETRDELIKCGIVDMIRMLIPRPGIQVESMKNICWIISNLCKGTPSVPIDIMCPLTEYFDVLLRVENDEIKSETLWAVSHFTEGGEEYVRLVLERVNLAFLAQFMKEPSLRFRSPAVKIIGNVCACSEVFVDTVITCGCLTTFLIILSTDHNVEIRKEVCWAVSNITAGPYTHIQHVIDHGLVESLSNVVLKDINACVTREATWALCNALGGGTLGQIETMVGQSALSAVSSIMLEDQEVGLLREALGAIKKVLAAGETMAGDENAMANKFEDIGGVKKLEALQMHANKEIYVEVSGIMRRYYETEEVLRSEIEEEAGKTTASCEKERIRGEVR